MAMALTWIVVADSSRARILEIAPRGREIHEVEDFVNPPGRAQGRELQTDADGRYYAKGGAGQPAHAAGPRTDPVEHEIELFAKRLGEFIEKARVDQRFGKLTLVAPPKFLGLLREGLTKEARKLVHKEIPKDLSQLTPAAIHTYVKAAKSARSA
jgi:protein required for attachment to host cells